MKGKDLLSTGMRRAEHLPFLFDIPRRNIVSFQENIHIPAAADQHNLCEAAGMDVFKTCDLFSVTDAGTENGFQVFFIVALFLTFSAKHRVHPPANTGCGMSDPVTGRSHILLKPLKVQIILDELLAQKL